MKSARGFTLLEILIALTLFALVGGALLQLFHGGLNTVSTAGGHAHAALLARSKLTELQAYRQLQPGVEQGEFEDGFRWRTELTEADSVPDHAVAGLVPLNLVLEVSWGDPGSPRRINVESLLLSRESGR